MLLAISHPFAEGQLWNACVQVCAVHDIRQQISKVLNGEDMQRKLQQPDQLRFKLLPKLSCERKSSGLRVNINCAKDPTFPLPFPFAIAAIQ